MENQKEKATGNSLKEQSDSLMEYSEGKAKRNSLMK